MTGFRVRYEGSRMRLVCTSCHQVCEVEDSTDVADIASEFARLHPTHRVPEQHDDDCPDGSVPGQ